MAEADRAAVADAGLNFLVDAAERLVGGQEHDQIGGCSGFLDQRDFQSGFLGRPCAAGRPTKPDDHVDSAVLEVQRLRPALVAVTENSDALPR